jgi:hypothetical protein
MRAFYVYYPGRKILHSYHSIAQYHILDNLFLKGYCDKNCFKKA